MSPGAISRVVVADKIQAIRRMLDGVRSLPLETLAAFVADPRMTAAGDSYLRRALEALLDLSRHVLAKGFGRAPAEYAEVARQLGDVGVIDEALATRLGIMARYRNRMVHFYDEITNEELHKILTSELGDIEAVTDAIRAWLAAHPDRTSDPDPAASK
jgi:uncharacterized protein YutE (UPF0331/DUF86 family)